MRPELRPNAPQLWHAAWGLAALGLGWLLTPPQEPETALVSQRVENWQQPKMARHDDSSALAARVIGAAFWGAVKPAASAASANGPDLRWRLAGTFAVAERQGVLLVFMDPSKAPQRLFVGDKLPENRLIVAIRGRDVLASSGTGREKKIETFKVERREN